MTSRAKRPVPKRIVRSPGPETLPQVAAPALQCAAPHTRTQTVGVHAFPMAGPDDLRPLEALIARGEVDPRTITAIITKTEGNGRVNDYTRPLAAHTLSRSLGRQLGIDPDEVPHRVALVMSGGCEGVMTPHSVVSTRREVAGPAASSPRLAIGVGFTRTTLPEELGTVAQVELAPEGRARLRGRFTPS